MLMWQMFSLREMMQVDIVFQVLRQVDFDQLKIENQQFLDRIEEKNNTMIQLKLLAGRSLHELNQQKRKLQVRLRMRQTQTILAI